jgi:hypothetical protein
MPTAEDEHPTQLINSSMILFDETGPERRDAALAK